MENKKQQNFSGPNNSKTSQSADSKRKTDLQSSKAAFPRAARRRDQQSSGPRNDQQRNSKQLSGKQRPYVDKRPRARGAPNGGGGSSGHAYFTERGNSSFAGDDVLIAGAGLVDDEFTDVAGGGTGNIGEFDDYDRHYLQMCKASGKRKNLNHLFNFKYTPREVPDYLGGGGVYGVFGSYGNSGGSSVGKRHQQQHKYNKEQFLQANFQFVIKSSAKPHLMTSPDTIIDWALIEQINIQTTEEPRCPICLYPPVAAKLTRCGHAYCWPCILHYLALNDKSWRKCPICYEAVHVADLKSTAILQQSQFNVGDNITFQLMRRKKGSIFIEKFSSSNFIAAERYPQYSGSSDLKPFSKFLLAKRSDILTIIERERSELMADEDTTCPEYVFVQQALNLLNERREQLGEIHVHGKDEEDVECEIGNENELKSSIMERPNDFENMIFGDATGKNTENEIKFQDAFEDLKSKESTEDPEEECLNVSLDQNQDSVNGFNVSITPTSDGAHAIQQKYYFFYQSLDGQNIFLHPLNVKMLQACYGSLEYAPLTINARILQKECHTMDEDLRRKFTCLGHLPLTCQFAVVEVDLQTPIVTKETLALFKDDIKQRKMERERRDREEKKREKKIAAINDRQMGKLISKTANINLSSSLEFPTCGFDYDLMPTSSTTANSFTTSAKIDVKTMESTVASVSGTPPGPSYSSVIMSKDISKANNTGLFPELSIKGKAKKINNAPNATKPSSVSMNSLAISNELLERDDGGDVLKSMGSTFGDFMEQAIVRKKANSSQESTMATHAGSTPVGKKQKRDKKKMVPLFPSIGGCGASMK